MTVKVNAAMFRSMIVAASQNLNNNREMVDSLNVFPVPDGDTGTNMSMTFAAAANEVANNSYRSVSDVATAVAKATLRGARGNSGVILSQIFRGISLSMKGLDEFGAKEFALALQSGCDTAYRAVMRPTEGTILTVIRKCAEAATSYEGDSIEELLDEVILSGNDALEGTTEMLPQLKAANVVDAGGQGLMCVIEGFLPALSGDTVAPTVSGEAANTPSVAQAAIDADSIKFCYCTEFIINKKHSDVDVDRLRNAISPKGDCMLVIDDDDVVKVHIHTNHPGFVLEQAVKLGEMVNIKIDNLRHQHTELIEGSAKLSSEHTPVPQTKPSNDAVKSEKSEEIPELSSAPEKKAGAQKSESKYSKDFAVVAVCSGDGIADEFKNLGVCEIISGGQTMNPSTEDILAAVEKTDAKNVIVLPNNKNIILAAQQVKYLTDRNFEVVPSRSIPQGLCAMNAFNPSLSIEENFEAMNAIMKSVRDGSVTVAVRDSNADGKDIKNGDYIAVDDHGILAVGEAKDAVAIELAGVLGASDADVIKVLYGEETGEEEAAALASKLEDEYPDAEVFAKRGGQSVYYYIISVE